MLPPEFLKVNPHPSVFGVELLLLPLLLLPLFELLLELSLKLRSIISRIKPPPGKSATTIPTKFKFSFKI